MQRLRKPRIFRCFRCAAEKSAVLDAMPQDTVKPECRICFPAGLDTSSWWTTTGKTMWKSPLCSTTSKVAARGPSPRTRVSARYLRSAWILEGLSSVDSVSRRPHPVDNPADSGRIPGFAWGIAAEGMRATSDWAEAMPGERSRPLASTSVQQKAGHEIQCNTSGKTARDCWKAS